MRQASEAAIAIVTALKCELAGDVLRSFGTLRFSATGWSMLPSILPGDTLVVESVRPVQVRLGEVVLVGREGKLRAHRVVGMAGDSENPRWFTQGDALSAPDPVVSRDELLGRVLYLIRAGKLVAVPPELSVVDSLVAKIVRRSSFAARAFVHLNRTRQTLLEPVSPCLD
ncbi:MAG: S24/S26 family peptidase [Candidatus Sulfotelmatobacter sp.]